jgi:hypothetical protein
MVNHLTRRNSVTDEKVKTTFLLNKEIHEALKIKAIKERTTLAALLEEGARRLLKEGTTRTTKKARGRPGQTGRPL